MLLEGKRKVLEQDKEKLIALGRLLASKTKKMIFRSGNAEGADQYFSDGVVSIDSKRLQVIIPYSGHRKKTNKAHETFSLDDINLANFPEVVNQSKTYKNLDRTINHYISGKKSNITMKAAYILRDTIKVIGTDKIRPASFGFFYLDLSDPDSGGTGHTVNVCKQNKVPYIDQRVWFYWLS